MCVLLILKYFSVGIILHLRYRERVGGAGLLVLGRVKIITYTYTAQKDSVKQYVCMELALPFLHGGSL